MWSLILYQHLNHCYEKRVFCRATSSWMNHVAVWKADCNSDYFYSVCLSPLPQTGLGVFQILCSKVGLCWVCHSCSYEGGCCTNYLFVFVIAFCNCCRNIDFMGAFCCYHQVLIGLFHCCVLCSHHRHSIWSLEIYVLDLHLYKKLWSELRRN